MNMKLRILEWHVSWKVVQTIFWTTSFLDLFLFRIGNIRWKLYPKKGERSLKWFIWIKYYVEANYILNVNFNLKATSEEKY